MLNFIERYFIQHKYSWLFLGCFTLIFYFIGGLSHHLLAPDEIRYVGIAGVMEAQGDWLINRIDGSPFFHKPPLFYWLTIIGIKLFGHSLVGYRFASYIASLLIIYTWSRFLYKYFNVTFAKVTLLALSFSMVWLGGQYANTDQLVAAMITATILFGVETALLMRAGKSYTKTLLLTYIFAAFGILSKGLIGVALPGLVILAWLIATGNIKFFWKYFRAFEILLFLVISFVPFIIIESHYPGFLYYFFMKQQILRFLSPGEFNNVNPWYFYLPIILLCAFPWLLLIAYTRYRGVVALHDNYQSKPTSQQVIDKYLARQATSELDSQNQAGLHSSTEATTVSQINQSVAKSQADKATVTSQADKVTTKTQPDQASAPTNTTSVAGTGVNNSEFELKVNELFWLTGLWLVLITTFFSIPQSKLVGYALPLVSPAVVICLTYLYHLYKQQGVDFNYFTKRASGFSKVITAIAVFFVVVFFGLLSQRAKLINSSYNLTNNKGEIFNPAALPAEKVEIYSVGRFPYSFQMFYEYYRPLKIILDLDFPGVRTTDNWRKEIIDGLEFDPHLEEQIFTNPDQFNADLCNPNSTLAQRIYNRDYIYVILHIRDRSLRTQDFYHELDKLPAEYSNGRYEVKRLTPSFLIGLGQNSYCSTINKP